MSSAITYRVYLFFKLIRNRLGKGLAKFEILEPYVSPRKLGNQRWADRCASEQRYTIWSAAPEWFTPLSDRNIFISARFSFDQLQEQICLCQLRYWYRRCEVYCGVFLPLTRDARVPPKRLSLLYNGRTAISRARCHYSFYLFIVHPLCISSSHYT